MSENLLSPQFLYKFLNGINADTGLASLFGNNAYDKYYCTYIAISNIKDLKQHWIVRANYNQDSNTIVLEMSKSKHAKLISDECSGKIVEYGDEDIEIYAKSSGKYVTFYFD